MEPVDSDRSCVRRQAFGNPTGVKRILLIDDEYVTVAMLEDMLSAKGYRVFTANSAGAGLRGAVENHPDLILLDIILPDRDGFSVLKDLQKNERTRNIPVVLMSALSKSQAFKDEPVSAFIQKPIVQREMLSVVDKLIGSP